MHAYHVKMVFTHKHVLCHATQTVNLVTIRGAGLVMVIVLMDVTKAFGAINVKTIAIIIVLTLPLHQNYAT
jgi:hypothetical protein